MNSQHKQPIYLSTEYWWSVPEIYELLKTSFPPEELDSLKALMDLAQDGLLELICARLYSNQLVGVAVGQRAAGTPVVLLAYLAIDPEYRGTGIGSRLLATAEHHWLDDGPAIIVAEVEDPANAESHPMFGDPVRRLQFYRRYGCQRLDVPYFMPALNGHGRQNILLLLVGASGRFVQEDRLLPSCRLDNFMRSYLTHAEGRVDENDAQTKELLDSFSTRMKLVDP